MSAPYICGCSCASATTTNIPGPQGATGETVPCYIITEDPTGKVAYDYAAGSFAFDNTAKNLYLKTAAGNVNAWVGLIIGET